MLRERRSDGTLYQERRKIPWPEGQVFKILSIDGGGIKGILPASILSHVESILGPDEHLSRKFDLIAGTSTGGIIAVGLGLGLKASDILRVYMDRGGKIFPSAPQPFRSIGRALGNAKMLVRRKYEATVLDHELEKVIGGRTFGESNCRLVVPAFDHNTEPYIFKTPHHPDYKKDWREDALTVTRATSAAPVYLEGLQNAGRHFWDGGLFANNPIMMALADALSCYSVRRQDVRILSLGCASDVPTLTKKHLKGGVLQWRQVQSVTSSLQSHDAIGQAGLLIGRDKITRVDAQLPTLLAMDDYHGAKDTLPSLAARLFEKNRAQISTFLETGAGEYTAYYGPKALPTDVT